MINKFFGITMTNLRISKLVCATVNDVLKGSHSTLDALFESAGAPGSPPDLSHASKWKEWLFRAGMDPNTDSLLVLGNVLEEFMDLPPQDDPEEYAVWEKNRKRVNDVLEENGFRYYRGGRVLPTGIQPEEVCTSTIKSTEQEPRQPSKIEELLEVLLRGLPRAMHPLSHRRKGVQPLTFKSEWDVQDLLHALLRPWVSDIRPEEFTPSYAGSSTRMDFLLPKYSLVLELKYVRDRAHGKKIGDELIIDIEHYRRHPKCDKLWCVIYDPNNMITNSEGLRTDIEGKRTTPDGKLLVKVLIMTTQ